MFLSAHIKTMALYSQTQKNQAICYEKCMKKRYEILDSRLQNFHTIFFAFYHIILYTCEIYFWKEMKKTVAMFDERNKQKKQLEFCKSVKKDAKVWEIWWYWEWINIGSEISKDGQFLRPCVLIQNNLWNWLYLIIPVTSSIYHSKIKTSIEIRNYTLYGLSKRSRILCNQCKCIDAKRLSNKVSSKKITWLLFTLICQNIINLITKNTLT